MGNNSSGLQHANEETAKRREEAREQGLAEQNVTGASPPEVEDASDAVDTGSLAGRKVPQSPGNAASRR